MEAHGAAAGAAGAVRRAQGGRRGHSGQPVQRYYLSMWHVVKRLGSSSAAECSAWVDSYFYDKAVGAGDFCFQNWLDPCAYNSEQGVMVDCQNSQLADHPNVSTALGVRSV